MPRQNGTALSPKAPDGGTKKPYAAPTLKRLGSVRDLTLGTATVGPSDAKAAGRKGA
jgi:hypothetical protein